MDSRKQNLPHYPFIEELVRIEGSLGFGSKVHPGLREIREQLQDVERLIGEAQPLFQSNALADSNPQVDELVKRVQSLGKHQANPDLQDTKRVQADEGEMVTLDSDPPSDITIDQVQGPEDSQQNDEADQPKVPSYEVIEKLGHGGMGVVWRAVQLSTGRNVALKVMKADRFASASHQYRFQREIELASMLEHPNIARVYEAGVIDDVRYFAMELVEGDSLGKYVKQSKLNHKAILQLFVRVLRAVQYAHQKGIIHRDLKPSNIMVSTEGVPYVLDFGLAKSLREETPGLHATQEGAIAGTPAYMSPEQALGKHSSGVDSRSDIYSLGVILYRLLTGGKLPHEPSGSTFELLRQIVEQEAVRPRVASPDIDIDTEAIVLKSLSKNMDNRYASAGEFADDIERLLAGSPVQARAATTAYLLQKWLVKHSGKILIAVLALFSLFGLAAFGFIREHRLRTTAEAEHRSAIKMRAKAELSQVEAQTAQENAEAVSDFLVETLGTINPSVSGRSVTVAEQLDKAAENLTVAFADQPLTKASMAAAIGKSYFGLGLYEEAQAMHQIAYDIRLVELGELDVNSLHSLNYLAISEEANGQTGEGLRLTERSFELWKQVFGPQEKNTIIVMANLTAAYRIRGLYDKAVENQEALLAQVEQAFGPDSDQVLFGKRGLAYCYSLIGRTKQAKELIQHVVSHLEETKGLSDAETLNAKGIMASILFTARNYQQSLDLIQEQLPLLVEQFGDEHPQYLGQRLLQAKVLNSLGRYKEAEQLAQETYQVALAVRSESRAQVLEYPRLIADALRGQQKYQECFGLLVSTYEKALEIAGPGHSYTLRILTDLTDICRQLGRGEDAVKYSGLALEGRLLNANNENIYTLQARRKHAYQLLLSKQYQQAAEIGKELVPLHRAQTPKRSQYLATAQGIYANALLFTGELEAAEKLLIECNQWRAKNAVSKGFALPFSRNLLGQVYSKQKRYELAEPLLIKSANTILDLTNQSYHVTERKRIVVEAMIDHYQDREMPEKAKAWQDRLESMKKQH